jgi:hypothetical protein
MPPKVLQMGLLIFRTKMIEEHKGASCWSAALQSESRFPQVKPFNIFSEPLPLTRTSASGPTGLDVDLHFRLWGCQRVLAQSAESADRELRKSTQRRRNHGSGHEAECRSIVRSPALNAFHYGLRLIQAVITKPGFIYPRGVRVPDPDASHQLSLR